MNTEALKKEFDAALDEAATRDALEQVERAFLGRQDGKLTTLLRGLKDVSAEERKALGMELNALKNEFAERLAERRGTMAGGDASSDMDFDLTLPPSPQRVGHQHPLTQFMDRTIDVFTSMGFETVDGPEVETDTYNFDKLNMGPDHPARDMWDTFYVESGSSNREARGGRLLLRTHTSPVQLRAMETRKPPVRIIVPGRVFRNEATDAGHETTFYQLEGFAIDRGVRMTDLIGTLKGFLEAIFGKVETRVRPHYYPFVEPGMDMDMRCLICSGKGCSVCKRSGWLEMLGSGMIHPNVLRAMHVDPKQWSGFAFGLGIDRFMMLYHGINDLRLSYSGDLRFVRQF